mgnify:CR=1 FL=1
MKILLTVLTLTACVTVLANDDTVTITTPDQIYTCWVYDDGSRICY